MSNVVEEVNDPLAESLLSAKRSTEDPLAVARALRPVIEAGAAESEEIGRIVDPVVDAVAESGLLGILVPREFGGFEAEPELCIDIMEELSYADGSFGWAYMAATFGSKGAATYTGPACVDAIFKGEAGFLTASHIAPNGKAEKVDGGYRITGKFMFGSGSQLASFFMGAFVLQEDGAPVRNEDGSPKVLMIFAPRENVVIDYSSWETAGMRATASYNFEFVDQVVPEDFVMDPSLGRQHGGPALDISVSMGHIAVSLGITNRILDELKGLAQRKQRQGRLTLIDQSTFQRDFGMNRALTDAARDHIRSVYRAWRDEAAENGTASLETRAHARLAACWATKVSTEVAHWAYNAAGSDGLRQSPENRLARCFRDIEAAAVHRHVDDNILIESSQVLLGVNSPGLAL